MNITVISADEYVIHVNRLYSMHLEVFGSLEQWAHSTQYTMMFQTSHQ